jgi:ATP adenylyltransferase
MSHLWSPWRMDYIKDRSDSNECPFCLAIHEEREEDSLIVHRGEKSFVMLNRYPYTSGHLMVLPYLHQEDLSALDRATRVEMMELIQQACRVLEDVYHPEGFNVGLNLGAAAGAGLPKHLHWHIVPRWMGDTNFMTTVGGMRVIPEALEDTLKRVMSHWPG